MSEAVNYSLGDIASLLSAATAFEGMPRAHAMRLAQLMEMHQYQPGQNLTVEGQSNHGWLMLVVSGDAKVTSKLVEGVSPVIYRRATSGHIIGEVGFIDNQPHSATCTAQTAMHVAQLRRDDFSALLEKQPLAAAQLMAGLLKVMAKRLRHANMTIQTLGVVHHGLQNEIASYKLSKAA